ncbi:L,D-transpeptidase family protein [Pseudoramibacter sp.]|jgi:lipoprotein-anchoring transpeptidase ErfK/SrfK|uniref:L,D-transpeptidase family protein n=1 Tax=Pseudoramibacter sp. TaxID=2034862 RepID=UPI0025F3A23E|nr:peptidoglycan binding domain-containing protein [Pseudoramibacter sp.]MCH4072445.1 peptidoglycan binding domain-containing protein [Pseudoramibacter sp.]MCH4106216.1 peptidoglycan binding domain-containing protein [Pseudoramibacter sp.]
MAKEKEKEQKEGLFEKIGSDSASQKKHAFDEEVRPEDTNEENSENTEKVFDQEPDQKAEDTDKDGESSVASDDPTEVVNARLRERSFEIAEDDENESEDSKESAAETSEEKPEAEKAEDQEAEEKAAEEEPAETPEKAPEEEKTDENEADASSDQAEEKPPETPESEDNALEEDIPAEAPESEQAGEKAEAAPEESKPAENAEEDKAEATEKEAKAEGEKAEEAVEESEKAEGEKEKAEAGVSEDAPKASGSKTNKIKWIGIIVGIIAIIYAGFAVYYHSHFLPRTTINGVAVSGKTIAQTDSALKNRADTYTVELKGRNSETEKISATALGLKYQGKSRVSALLNQQNAWSWPARLVAKDKAYSAISCDTDKLNYLISHLFQVSGSQVKEARNAQPVYKDGKIVIEDEVSGNTVDQTKLKKLILSAVKTGSKKIDLKAEDCYVQPKYSATSAKVKKAAAKMNKMLNAQITYTFGSDKVVVDKSVFGAWLTVDDNMNVQIDETQLKKYLYDLAYKTNTYYGKHTFKTTGGSTITVNGGNYGWRIDRDAEAKKLTAEIKAGKVISRDPEYSKKGKVRNSTYDDIGDSYVEVSINDQHMWVYKDGKKVVDTAVVTGDVTKGNGTTPGAYYIAYKERHATLKGEGYSTPVSYWMPFNGGQGIHDSYWRGAYGGTIYRGNGSHGCVNTPPAQVALVWDNVSQGTPVIVY